MNLIFKEKLNLQGGVTEFVFTTETPTEWRAGQYVHITLPHDNPDDRGIERWFTIVTAPYEQDIAIATRIAPENGSTFKQELLNLNAGNKVETDQPGGSFVIDDFTRDYVLVAGGIGITPFRSILAQAAKDGINTNITLLYANRDNSTKAYADELAKLAQNIKGLSVTDFFGDNHINEQVLADAASKLNQPIFYVSGPEPMVEAFEKTLTEMGIPEERRKFDYFPGYPGV